MTGPFKARFHVRPQSDDGTKVCSDDPGHVTKMAAMAIYDKNALKIFSETSRQMTFELGIQYQRVTSAQSD